MAAPDAIALLKADHRAVEALFEDFKKARGAARKAAIVHQLCVDLTVHTMIEEEIFYPACRGKIEDSTLDEAYVEHDGAKLMIAEQVWDMHFDSDANVVEVAIKRLRAKVDAPFPVKLLHTLRGMGYVLEVRDEPAQATPA